MTVLFNNLQDYKVIVMKNCKGGLLGSGTGRRALFWPYVALGSNAITLNLTCPAVSCRSATVFFPRMNVYDMLELCKVSRKS